jgi:hypothetical protein
MPPEKIQRRYVRAALDSSAPLRYAKRPAARQHPRPDAEIGDAEVSWLPPLEIPKLFQLPCHRNVPRWRVLCRFSEATADGCGGRFLLRPNQSLIVKGELVHELRPRHHRATRRHVALRSKPRRLGWSVRTSSSGWVAIDFCGGAATTGFSSAMSSSSVQIALRRRSIDRSLPSEKYARAS